VTVTGAGTVTSNPAGINCGQTCTASFPSGTAVTLTEAPSPANAFDSWSGACSGNASTCSITITAATSVGAKFAGTLQSLNHIIFLAQENRSFDHYFGALREYWAQSQGKFPDQDFDGLPQFNHPAGATPTNPGCDPTSPVTSNCNATPNDSNPISSFHLLTQCIENTSPSWNESHVDWNLGDPVHSTATLDGFVNTAANNSRRNTGYLDVNGIRAMGYYDGTDLNYYYFMASSFATSDTWFSPLMSRTQPNRLYLIAATSQGHVYPPPIGSVITAKTIFEELETAGLTWKIYVPSQSTQNSSPCADNDSLCLINYSEIGMFQFGQMMKSNPTLLAHVQSVTQYLQDVQNGTLPNVALIEPAYGAGLDEHPTVNVTPGVPPTRIQAGAKYVSTLINGLMNSPSWKDSAFILTFDEGGGLYDHVAPIAVPNPDGIQPSDLVSSPPDICTITWGDNCDFTFTGYRVPLIVVSPFTKKNYVSHKQTDYTAILKLIEKRFNLPHLTNRDAAASDMSDFFDFTNVPWATPPASVPAQATGDPCYLNSVP
jgi:phospholipase C